MATKAVILSQKNGEAADILLPHTSADLTGYENEAAPSVENVKSALDELFKKQDDGAELAGRVSALEKSVGAAEQTADAAQTAAQAAQAAAEGKAPKAHASAEETYGKGTGELYGHVKLSDTAGTSGVSSGTAATPKAVADEVKKYLPLAGGTMTGEITFNKDGKRYGSIYTHKTETTDEIGIEADSSGTADDGGVLCLCTKDHPTVPGGFALCARTSTNDRKFLIGRRDGTLTWCGTQLAPMPTKYSGSNAIGSFLSLYGYIAQKDDTLKLPTGGTWAYFYIGCDARGAVVDVESGVVAGGTQIPTTDDSNRSPIEGWGFCWRLK